MYMGFELYADTYGFAKYGFSPLSFGILMEVE